MNTKKIIKALSRMGIVMTGFQFIEPSVMEQKLRNKYIDYKTSITGALQMPTFEISLVSNKSNPASGYFFKNGEKLEKATVCSDNLSLLRNLMDEAVKTKEVYIRPYSDHDDRYSWQVMKFDSGKNEFVFESLKEKPLLQAA